MEQYYKKLTPYGRINPEFEPVNIGWVKTSEELPEEEGDYIVATSYEWRERQYFNGDKFVIRTPTYWLKAPPLPKESPTVNATETDSSVTDSKHEEIRDDFQHKKIMNAIVSLAADEKVSSWNIKPILYHIMDEIAKLKGNR